MVVSLVVALNAQVPNSPQLTRPRARNPPACNFDGTKSSFVTYLPTAMGPGQSRPPIPAFGPRALDHRHRRTMIQTHACPPPTGSPLFPSSGLSPIPSRLSSSAAVAAFATTGQAHAGGFCRDPSSCLTIPQSSFLPASIHPPHSSSSQSTQQP